MNGVFAKVRPRAVSGAPVCFKAKPQTAFMRGDNFFAGRFANDGQVRAKSAGGQGARAGLGVLLVNEAGENDFRRGGTRTVFCKAHQSGEERGDGTLPVSYTHLRAH